MQVNVPSGSVCMIGEEAFDLLQWHFHSPSEHALASRREAMEVHLVHRNPKTGESLLCMNQQVPIRGSAIIFVYL